jgi:hypothetical protein
MMFTTMRWRVEYAISTMIVCTTLLDPVRVLPKERQRLPRLRHCCSLMALRDQALT